MTAAFAGSAARRLLALALFAMAGCADSGGAPEGFHPAISCQGIGVDPALEARCRPYRQMGGRD